jgi:sugar transferase (PEP-CTERM/EpsH1 system associated)
MRILIVSPFIPLPATEGGRIRVLNLLRHLSPKCEITLLAPRTFNSTPHHERLVRDIGVDLIVTETQPHLSIGLISSMARGYPVPLAKYNLPDFSAALCGLVEGERFDVVQFEMLHAGQYLPHLRRSSHNRHVPTVLVQHNLDSLVWMRLHRVTSSPPRKLGALIQAMAFRRLEGILCPMFDLCICMSERDARRLREIAPAARAEIVPNGVDLDFFRPMKGEVKRSRVIYVGSMDWYPNEDAAVYFCQRIWPIVKARIPDAEFYIVGQYPGPEVRALSSIDGVYVTGLVDDVRPYMASSSVFVVPLRIGGGTRLKILEALAMEKAVVSTSIGCEGLELSPNEDLIVTDDPAEFAEWIIRLMEDDVKREELGRSGRRRVAERFGWDRVAEKMLGIYEMLTKGGEDGVRRMHLGIG